MGALWAGVSGLDSYSTAISVVANNLANVNTTGFKSSRTLFSDLISSLAGGTSDGSQVGNGVGVGSISLSTSTGGYSSTSSSLDMAITGEDGYFQVRDAINDKTYYTRAGSFNFDNSGYLVNSQGLRVQGWAVDEAAEDAATAAGTSLSTVPTTGSQTDIQITNAIMSAQATSSLTLATNLDSTTDASSTDATDPYFSMFKSYDATSGSTVSNADYSTSLTVYDSEGNSHDLTVSYKLDSTDNGQQTWEYMITMDADEDGNSTTSGTSKSGVLMMGTLTFSSSGVLQNETAYTLDSNATDPTSLSSWTQATLSTSGVPEFSATFIGSSATDVQAPQTISFATGLSCSTSTWNASNPTTAAGIGSNASATAGFATSTTVNASTCTTNYATTSYTLSHTANGYTTGPFKSAYVDDDGVIYGSYSNGQSKALWVLSLADFTNASGLTSEGDNLYSAGSDSGQMTIGRANSGKFDSIAGYTLESSNVELATEMTNLIILQRAFESNSKVVTTADDMMEKTMQIVK
jgi:flagellar hook protein FlgE